MTASKRSPSCARALWIAVMPSVRGPSTSYSKESGNVSTIFFSSSLTVTHRWLVRQSTARGHTYEGMLSGQRPLFESIETYYHEINVALLKEEERLKEIKSSLRVTPDDKLRWQNIRDACMEASTLLTSEVGSTFALVVLVSPRLQHADQLPPSPPHMPQQTPQTVSVSPIHLCHSTKR